MPDIHAAKVRAVGVRIADPLHHAKRAFLPELFQPVQRRVQPQPFVQPEHLRRGHGQRGTSPPVKPVAVGHHGVQAVVAPGKLHHDQHPVPRGVGGRPGRTDQKLRHPGASGGHQGRGAQGLLQETTARAAMGHRENSSARGGFSARWLPVRGEAPNRGSIRSGQLEPGQRGHGVDGSGQHGTVRRTPRRTAPPGGRSDQLHLGFSVRSAAQQKLV